MTRVTDEQLMRTALADLTDDQPPMPPGRFQSVRRRVVRHRKRQIASAAVSALAVAGIVVSVAQVPGILHPSPSARQVPGWALPWPDYRNGSVPQSVLNNAVLAWHEQAVGQTAPASLSPREIARQVRAYHVIWYVGQKVGHGHSVAVIFEATSPGTGPQLVVGWADASGVMGGQAAWQANSSPWVLTTMAAPGRPASFGPDISEYLSLTSASGVGADTWILVLPKPGAVFGNMSTNSTATSTVTTATSTITAVKSSPGFFAADIGQIQSDVILGFGGARTQYVPVGIGGNAAVAPLAPPRALQPPASFQMISSWDGQASSPGANDLSVTAAGGPYAVLANCYNALPNAVDAGPPTPGGHGPLRIVINGHRVGSLPCDSQQHELRIPRSMLRPHGIMITASSSSLTSWQISFGRVR
jgi:hypothetical protein